MARLRVATGWERLIVPAFVYFFAQLYPVPLGQPARGAGRPRRAAVCCCAGGGGAGRGPGRHPAGGHRRRGARPSGQALRRGDLAGPRRPGGQRAAVPGACRAVADGLAQRVRPAAAQSAAAARRPSLGSRWCTSCRPSRWRAALTRRTRRRAGGRRAWALMTATYLPMLRYYRQTLVAGSAAAADRVSVSADDRRLGGAALAGARRGLEGAHVRRAPARALPGAARHLRPGVQFMPQPYAWSRVRCGLTPRSGTRYRASRWTTRSPPLLVMSASAQTVDGTVHSSSEKSTGAPNCG